jgi:hypothetical protein
MKNTIVIALLMLAAWYSYDRYQRRAQVAAPEETASARSTSRSTLSSVPPPTGNAFKCDGRIYCSQMTSCAEATYFLRNCPGTKMDGDHDGVPCESQWCGR